jgi:probable HAF family extracellular repeat protein
MKFVTAIAVLGVPSLVPTPVFGQASFTPLPGLGGATPSSFAADVSDDGLFACGGAESTNGNEAAVWDLTAVSVRAVGYLPGGGTFAEAYGVSEGGHVVVGQSWNGAKFEAFRSVDGGPPQGMGTLLPGAPQTTISIANAVSADGSVIAGYSRTPLAANGIEAFRYTGGVMTGIGDLAGDGFLSNARGCSPDGSVIIGDATDADGSRGFRWTSGGGMVALEDLPGGSVTSQAHALSRNGRVIVGRSIGAEGSRAVAWRDGVIENLGALEDPDADSTATGVNADGSIIVGTSYVDPFNIALIWRANRGIMNFQDVLTDEYGLDLTGWILFSAEDITPDGTTIVGYGLNPNNVIQAYVVRLPGGCEADFNGDQQVDFFDYLDFAQAFDADDPTADFNGDNQIDFFDYLDFVQAFDACQ